MPPSGNGPTFAPKPYPNEVFEGRVTRALFQALNRATRATIMRPWKWICRIRTSSSPRGGMFARVEVLVGKHLQIP